MRSRVVLPAPFGPIRVTISPRCTAMSTPASTARLPNRLPMPRPQISASGMRALVPAVAAKPGQLDHAALDGEAARRGTLLQRRLDMAVVQLRRRAAVAADQEL